MAVGTQAEKEERERQRRAERRARQKRRHAFIEKHKIAIIAGAVLSVIGMAFLFWLIKVAYFSYLNLKKRIKLNETVGQISQLVENVRTAYAIHLYEDMSTLDKLIEVGAVPEKLLRKGSRRPVNLYGGDILIQKSLSVTDPKTGIDYPSFKISYQGLPQDACVALAMMNWGGAEHGLLAMAVGSVSAAGEDKAFIDVDKKPEPEELREWIDKNGRKRVIRPRKHYPTNVAKPGDKFMPAPFSLHNAETGCSCGGVSQCSFALRYTVFGIKR